MLWIKSFCNLKTHPKTVRLARLLDERPAHVVGYLHCLWHWAMEYAQDGDLSRFDALDIANAAGWHGDPEQFVKALLSCGPGGSSGFLDVDVYVDDHETFSIHDWDDYGGGVFRKKANKAARQKRWRKNKSDAQTVGNTKSSESEEECRRLRDACVDVTDKNRIDKITPLYQQADISPPLDETTQEDKLPKKQKPIPYSEIAKAYNSILGQSLREVGTMTESRKKAVRARWGESEDRQSLEWWTGYFETVKSRPFLLGKNDRNWQSDFDWLIKQQNMAKILEGKYQDNVPGSKRPLKDYREMGFVK